jgi:hypothetical protein
VSPATAAACVRARRVNGETENASAPEPTRLGLSRGLQPSSDAIKARLTAPGGLLGGKTAYERGASYL